uniref:Putative secreted peptide n=1 Tax=Anopheles braziliensis TaxID=58242 RepID=A0A2M3ZS21_9DIPT
MVVPAPPPPPALPGMIVVLLPLLLLLLAAVIVPATLLSPAAPQPRAPMLQPPSFCVSFRRIRIPGSHSRRAARDDDDEGRPVRVLFVVDVEAIFDLRSGKVSITRSRNSSRAPTSFCNSCSDLVWSVT